MTLCNQQYMSNKTFSGDISEILKSHCLIYLKLINVKSLTILNYSKRDCKNIKKEYILLSRIAEKGIKVDIKCMLRKYKWKFRIFQFYFFL